MAGGSLGPSSQAPARPGAPALFPLEPQRPRPFSPASSCGLLSRSWGRAPWRPETRPWIRQGGLCGASGRQQPGGGEGQRHFQVCIFLGTLVQGASDGPHSPSPALHRGSLCPGHSLGARGWAGGRRRGWHARLVQKEGSRNRRQQGRQAAPASAPVQTKPLAAPFVHLAFGRPLAPPWLEGTWERSHVPAATSSVGSQGLPSWCPRVPRNHGSRLDLPDRG